MPTHTILPPPPNRHDFWDPGELMAHKTPVPQTPPPDTPQNTNMGNNFPAGNFAVTINLGTRRETVCYVLIFFEKQYLNKTSDLFWIPSQELRCPRFYTCSVSQRETCGICSTFYCGVDCNWTGEFLPPSLFPPSELSGCRRLWNDACLLTVGRQFPCLS